VISTSRPRPEKFGAAVGLKKICLASADAGLIRCEKLATELGLPVFVTMPNIRQLIEDLRRD
jgi:hypothetical protein